MKKFLHSFIVLLALVFISSTMLIAQEVILSDEFDNGDSQWTSGWIDAGTTTVTVSIDTNGVLSGKNSYLLDVVEGGPDTYRIQRNANCPLLPGKTYKVSFMAVADRDVTINVLFEIAGDPYTKRIIEWPLITTTPQTFQYVYNSSENVPTNQLKLHFGGPDNDNYKIWVDNIIVTEENDVSLISNWGLTQEYKSIWPVLNTAETAAGNASMGGDVVAGWKGLQGGFSQDLSISTEQAVIVTGQIEFVGADAGDNYTPIRYALTYQDSSELLYALTDSAQWSRSGLHSGYEFCPRTGAGTMANGNGGAGTVWTVNNGNWASTWSNNGGPIAAINQQPRNAEIIAGTYDFAISVQAIDDTTNEVRWYMVEQSNGYWFGGTVVDTATTKKFNSIIFGVNEVEYSQINVIGMRAELGAPIEVPEAPWEKYYVDQWGLTQEYKSLWPILNDSMTLVGDASMGGEVVAGWKGLQGGFGQNVAITTDKAVIVTGQIEFVGADAGDAYTPIRYAITRQDSSQLLYALTDSAQWSRSGLHSGYEFCPRTGAGTMANGNGGAGTVWTVNNGNWASTWSNNGKPIAAVNQQPRNANMVAGTYDFAISVHSIDDVTNEIRWYMIEEDNGYWFGGTVVDTSTTKEFNSIIFGVNEVEYSQFNVIAMEVDKGAPIEVPEAPWEKYYVDQWGLTQEYKSIWPILNDSTTLVGDASMGGEVVAGWKGLQGGFGQNVAITTDKAVIVTGQIEFVGADAGDAYTPIRYALTRQDSSQLLYALTDSAQWSRSGLHSGYEFCPRTGAGTMANGGGGAGTVWTVNNGNWASTWSNNGKPIAAVNQAPRNANMVAGTYDFAISVHSIDDTTNEVRWYMIEENNAYWFGGVIKDTSTTKEFNSIIFGVNEVEYSQFNVIAMEVDKGDPIIVPARPFNPFYVAEWGFIGGRTGSWSLTPGDVTGNVTISGAGASGGWSAVRGGFDDIVEPSVGRNLAVTGKIMLTGGGFEDWSSLRMGIFYSDSAGTIDTTAAGLAWNGVETSSNGYLFMPPSGSNDPVNWSGPGEAASFGAVVDASWISTGGANNYVLGNIAQQPAGAVGTAGEYEFGLYVLPQADGTSHIRFSVTKVGGGYSFIGSAVDNHDPMATKQFNSICVALNSTTATGLDLIDVHVDLVEDSNIPVSVKQVNAALPTEYALSQNYPNPFNPTTTIEFALPEASKVKLVVYDLMGRQVAELANGNFNAGYYRIHFNANNLPSGVYLYKIEAGKMVDVKKLMLMK